MNLGLVRIRTSGSRVRAAIKHMKIETEMSQPKKNMGMKVETMQTANPTMTEKPLIIIPCPVVLNVFTKASSSLRPFRISVLNLNMKCMV